MYYVGIDQSIRNTGWCVLSKDGVEEYGNIKPGSLRGPERLAYIQTELLAVLDNREYAFGAMEEGSYNSAGQLFQLGGVHAIAQLALWSRSITFAGVAPVQVKKFATGKSGAKKEWVIEAVTHVLKIKETIDDNIADAACLALIARAVSTGVVRTRAEAEVVHSLQTSGKVWQA